MMLGRCGDEDLLAKPVGSGRLGMHGGSAAASSRGPGSGSYRSARCWQDEIRRPRLETAAAARPHMGRCLVLQGREVAAAAAAGLSLEEAGRVKTGLGEAIGDDGETEELSGVSMMLSHGSRMVRYCRHLQRAAAPALPRLGETISKKVWPGGGGERGNFGCPGGQGRKWTARTWP